ncbi:MAG: hypothetical protein L3J07_03375 [Candidatus Magasanikbacteria bacterium]|nr:hypothetical protein [Candidatus Magasanikbacteria bacterium]
MRGESNFNIPEFSEDEQKWLEHIYFFDNDFGTNEELRKSVRDRAVNPDNFLGEGGIGRVVDLGSDVCIKFMLNRANSENKHLYNLGCSPKEEVEFMHKLKDFLSEGVHSPNVAAYYVGNEGAAIIMEKINGLNLQFILLGKESLPEGFNIDNFFERLDGYLQDMHSEFGIAHGDIYARNIMIDIETGNPVLIDFGRSMYLKGDDPTKDRNSDLDLSMLEDVYDKVAKFIEKA